MLNFSSKEWYVSKVNGRITHISHKPTEEDFKQQEENSVWNNVPNGWYICGGMVVPPKRQ